MYIDIENMNYPVSETEIRSLYKNTSFTFPFIPPENYKKVFETSQPEFNSVIQMVEEIQPIKIIDKWYQRWEIKDKFKDYFDENQNLITKKQQEDLAISKDIFEKSERLKILVVQRTQERLDDFARTRNYDNILSACTYATSTVPKFQAEGQYCVDARDNTWATLYSLLAEVQAGTRPMPSSYEEVEPLLPPLVWPN